jgi:hypothetical protein
MVKGHQALHLTNQYDHNKQTYFAGYMNTVVLTIYDLFNHKLKGHVVARDHGPTTQNDGPNLSHYFCCRLVQTQSLDLKIGAHRGRFVVNLSIKLLGHGILDR